MIWSLVAIAVLLGVAMAFIRMASDDPHRWHVDPMGMTKTKAKNDFIVAPAGGDMASDIYDMTPEALMTRFQTVALAAPRVTLLGDRDGFATYIQRSTFFGFPDYISVRAVPAEGGAQLYIYARARYGGTDFGVNKARVLNWLKRL